jgi:hypothetical protein
MRSWIVFSGPPQGILATFSCHGHLRIFDATLRAEATGIGIRLRFSGSMEQMLFRSRGLILPKPTGLNGAAKSNLRNDNRRFKKRVSTAKSDAGAVSISSRRRFRHSGRLSRTSHWSAVAGSFGLSASEGQFYRCPVSHPIPVTNKAIQASRLALSFPHQGRVPHISLAFREMPGFPVRGTEQRPRVRLSSRKAA